MSVPAGRSDPRWKAENVLRRIGQMSDPLWPGLTESDWADWAGDLARELLAALDREAALWQEAEHPFDQSEFAALRGRAEAAERALREIDAEATRVLWDYDGVSTEPMFDELAIKIIAAREALAAAEGQQT